MKANIVNFGNGKGTMMKKLQRYDLDRCYSYGEYNETINYGNMNSHLEGVQDYILQLNNEKQQYEQEMRKVIDAERDNENRKYHFWEKWRKIKFIFLAIFVGGLILNSIIGNVFNGTLEALLNILICLLLVLTLILFLIAAVIQVISGKLYFRYADNLKEHLDCINNSFDYKAKKCYLAIDDIYLKSLEPSHREIVLMRREQNEHNRKLEKIAEERRILEQENLEENRKIRNTQEQLLEIELERENRRYR